MDRREVLEDAIAKLRAVLDQLEGKTMERPDADAHFNGWGKVIKGVQLHLVNEEWLATRARATLPAEKMLALAKNAVG